MYTRRLIQAARLSMILAFTSTVAFSQSVISVSQKGIVPNDNKDDADKINQLIASAPANSTLLFSDGTYNIGSPIILKSNITIKGTNPNTVIFRQTGSIANWQKNSAQGIITTSQNIVNDNVHVTNITVKGIYTTPISEAGSGGKGGICMRNCTNSSVKNVSTSDTWHGVAFYDNKGNAKTGNLIENAIVTRALSNSQPGNSGRPRGILMNSPYGVVKGCTSSNSGTGYFLGGTGIEISDCKALNWTVDNGYYIMVENCVVRDCQAITGSSSNQGKGSGFTIAYQKGGLVENCKAQNCGNYGFRIHVPQSNLTLRNNIATNCGIGFGIENASHPYPEMCDNLQFIGNQAIGNNLQGFFFRQMMNSKVENNTAKNNNQKGINARNRGAITLQNYTYGNIIEDNVCEDTQTKKTQLFGLYDYNKGNYQKAAVQQNNTLMRSATKATNNAANAINVVPNTIKHNSKFGQDYY
ncbi:parallel beta helix pectate lyase-like protein [Chitinophaga skermanii]|uniref:Parallel beta helix pectate lyase-like protein n=1 Tax=Chitinophaga skermanii TaxID=331697 RepID=A0A327R423_9BACT|nr:right-handed parallel beta-helix repeat-containing protein [Chitinophaga skermanii]RAJ10524.1 parallel beta helix pectate lyase-like protein [Chitinophaga skermanii]